LLFSIWYNTHLGQYGESHSVTTDSPGDVARKRTGTNIGGDWEQFVTPWNSLELVTSLLLLEWQRWKGIKRRSRRETRRSAHVFAVWRFDLLRTATPSGIGGYAPSAERTDVRTSFCYFWRDVFDFVDRETTSGGRKMVRVKESYFFAREIKFSRRRRAYVARSIIIIYRCKVCRKQIKSLASANRRAMNENFIPSGLYRTRTINMISTYQRRNAC